MRIWPALVLGGCLPHLYSDRSSDTGCAWTEPVNGWPMDTPPDCLRHQGYGVGEAVPDVRLDDQFGAEVSFHQFWGDVVLLDVSTLWCRPCRALAADAEDVWQTYRDQGFVYLTVIQQSQTGDPAEPADVQAWVDAFGLTAPVLGDPEAVTRPAQPIVGGGPVFPGLLLIGRDLRVIEPLGEQDDLRAAIAAQL